MSKAVAKIRPDEQPAVKKPGLKGSVKAKLYMEIAMAVSGGHPGLPPFPHKFHVVEPEDGVRLLVLEKPNRVACYCAQEGLAGAILRYCNRLGKSRFMLTFDDAKNAAKVWMHTVESIPEPAAVAELSDERLAFHRLPFDVPRETFDTPPLFEEFLSRCTNRLALAAFIGSLFEPDADRQQYVWIHGAGDNGKGSLAYVLKNVLGRSFHSETVPDPKRGPNSFWTSAFVGKRLVLFPECSNPQFPQSGLFKSLTGGDAIRIERKNKDAYSADLHCKFMFFSNEELVLSSQKADLRRAIYCHVDPIKTPADTSYYDRLWQEAPLILASCRAVYQERCPNHGRIPIEDNIDHLADMYDAKFDNFFKTYFIKTDDADRPAKEREYVTPSELQDLFASARVLNPREQNRYIDYFGRAYGVSKIDLRGDVEPRRRYVGLKRRQLPNASWRNPGEPRESPRG